MARDERSPESRAKVGFPVPNQGGVAARRPTPTSNSIAAGGRPKGLPSSPAGVPTKADTARRPNPVPPMRQTGSTGGGAGARVGFPTPSGRLAAPTAGAVPEPRERDVSPSSMMADQLRTEETPPAMVPEVVAAPGAPTTPEERQAQQPGQPDQAGQPQVDVNGNPIDPSTGLGVQPGGVGVQQMAGPMAKQEFTLTRPVGSREMDSAGPGIYHTPNADIERTAEGRTRVLGWTEAGRVRFQALQRSMESPFGSYPGKDDPQAPKPPLVPGMPAFNPYNGTWSGMSKEDSILDKF